MSKTKKIVHRRTSDELIEHNGWVEMCLELNPRASLTQVTEETGLKTSQITNLLAWKTRHSHREDTGNGTKAKADTVPLEHAFQLVTLAGQLLDAAGTPKMAVEAIKAAARHRG